MTDLPPARRLRRSGDWTAASGRVVLDYEGRFLRRRRLVTETGAGFLVDLPETVSLAAGDALELEDGRVIEVAAAAEDLLEITGEVLRFAWHIGNRHTPCQIGPGDRLTIRADHVLEAMLRGLGAEVRPVRGPFTPEAGAYGHGRTMGHDHGHGGHGHGHDHGHHHHHGGADGHGHAPGGAG